MKVEDILQKCSLTLHVFLGWIRHDNIRIRRVHWEVNGKFCGSQQRQADAVGSQQHTRCTWPFPSNDLHFSPFLIIVAKLCKRPAQLLQSRWGGNSLGNKSSDLEIAAVNFWTISKNRMPLWHLACTWRGATSSSHLIKPVLTAEQPAKVFQTLRETFSHKSCTVHRVRDISASHHSLACPD